VKTGDTVKVYPHGKPGLASEGTVMVISGNQLAIGVSFTDKPAFVVDQSGGLAIHRTTGDLILLANRIELRGVPWGPWVELFGQGHFEIEACE
jgi:hypothetical protein